MVTDGTAQAAGRKFHALDGLRGLAAISVMMWHTPHAWPAGVVPGSGYLSVDLFFGLSGFVLAFAYDDRFARGLGTAAFMTMRLIRLFPLYFLACSFKSLSLLATWAAFGTMYWPWTPDVLAVSSVLNYLFLPVPPSLAPHLPMYPLADQAWSLFFELIVNLLFVLFWRWLTIRVLLAICALSAVVLVALSLAGGGLNAGMTWDTLGIGLARVLFSFPMGVLLYRLSRGQGTLAIHPAILLVLFLPLVWMPFAGLARAIYDPLVILLAFPALIYVSARTLSSPRWTAVFTFLGLTSYGVYLLHRFFSVVFDAVAANLAARGVDAFVPWGGILFVALMLGFTWLLDRAYDTPIRGWLSARLLPQRSR